VEDRKRLFCTDGIRGAFGRAPIDVDFFLRIGSAIASLCAGGGTGRPIAVIGRDSRFSGNALQAAISSGLGEGVDIYDVGVLSTAAIAFLTRFHGAALGISITASHNPFTDNGIKLFNGQGEKWSDGEEMRLEAEIKKYSASGRSFAAPRHCKNCHGDGVAIYKSHFLGAFPKKCLRRLRIVLDCANGAASSYGPELLRELGAEIIAVANEPNGKNINENVGSEHGEFLCENVRRVGAHMGIALDGDGDRALICDRSGCIISGEHLLASLALDLGKNRRLKGNAAITTIQSNMALDRHLSKDKIRVFRSDVGDRNVYAMMRQCGCNLGGESSGHIIFSDFSPSADGLFTATSFIESLANAEDFSVEKSPFYFPMDANFSLNVPVKKKIPIEEITALQRELAAIRREFSAAGTGRVLVRYSGTENKLRILVEAETPQRAKMFAEKVLGSIADIR
jgi:phosphoglucosamine mutase